jgi:Rap1a immunity proteins
MRLGVVLVVGCSFSTVLAAANPPDPGLIAAYPPDSGLKYPNTVHGVYQWCTSPQPTAKGYCAGFVNGALGEITYSNHLCFSPEGVSTQELIQAFQKWHDAHREAWQESASDGARSAFLAAWPCYPR